MLLHRLPYLCYCIKNMAYPGANYSFGYTFTSYQCVSWYWLFGTFGSNWSEMRFEQIVREAKFKWYPMQFHTTSEIQLVGLIAWYGYSFMPHMILARSHKSGIFNVSQTILLTRYSLSLVQSSELLGNHQQPYPSISPIFAQVLFQRNLSSIAITSV